MWGGEDDRWEQPEGEFIRREQTHTHTHTHTHKVRVNKGRKWGQKKCEHYVWAVTGREGGDAEGERLEAPRKVTARGMSTK